MDPQLRPFSALRAEGWTSYRLRKAVASDELVRLTRNVYAPPADLPPRDQHLRRAAALLHTHRGSVVLSHVSAALVHGLPVQRDNPTRVHLTVPPPSRAKVTPAYHLHSAPLADADVTTVDGFRVTSLARTVADLARTGSFAWSVAAADRALALGAPRDLLSDAVERSKGMTGIDQARAVVAFADARSESVAESASRVTIHRAELPTPELQYVLTFEGQFVARGDFAWPEWKLIGEMDGKVKYKLSDAPHALSPEDVMKAQNTRQERIRQAGWWVTRWGWEEAWDPTKLGHLVRTSLSRQGWRP